MGVCGFEGNAIVFESSYEGTQDYYLTGDSGHGEDVCRIRYDTMYVADCFWAHEIVLSNPLVLIDINGACANSDLAYDKAQIADTDGLQVSYGYAPEKSGHMEILFTFDEDKDKWIGLSHSTGWDEETGEFTYRSTRNCG